jgi:hypothetical protein
MAKVTVTTKDGIVVKTIDASQYDLSKIMGRGGLTAEVQDAVRLATELETTQAREAEIRKLRSEPRTMSDEDIITALHETWKVIASDILTESGGKMTGSEVREAVPDFLGTYGSKSEAGKRKLVTEYMKLPDQEQERLLKLAFPHPRYTL